MVKRRVGVKESFLKEVMSEANLIRTNICIMIYLVPGTVPGPCIS